ncbi:MAG TPA: serine hydrolase [Candidatus Dormibacteraeota bacterium]|nr:serine hydrolase [Candidatus Dormibacteraeota bacterium]
MALAVSPAARGQGTAPVAAQYETGRAAVENVIRESGAKEVSVAFRSLDGSDEFFIQAGQEIQATPQWVEIPVMIELYAEVQTRALRFDSLLLVHNSFHSAVGQSVYHLDPGRDPDPELYHEIGRQLTLRELEQQMMMRNSQLATNLLIEHLGLSQINERIARLHGSGVELRHGFQDADATGAGLRNTESARGMMEVLWALANNAVTSAEASKEMMGVLANARTAETGPFSGAAASGAAGTSQEALVVYGAHSFALAVVTQGLEAGPTTALMAKISHALTASN